VRNALSGNSVRIDGGVVTDPKMEILFQEKGILIEMGKKKAKRLYK
jgi:hypothetical protein